MISHSRNRRRKEMLKYALIGLLIRRDWLILYILMRIMLDW